MKPTGRIFRRRFSMKGCYTWLRRDQSFPRADKSGRLEPLESVTYPIGSAVSISADRRWITTVGTMPNRIAGTYAVPSGGGSPERICSGCVVLWAPNGRNLYVLAQQPSLSDSGKTWVIPLQPSEMLPNLPASGLRTLDVRLRLRKNHHATQSVSYSIAEIGG